VDGGVVVVCPPGPMRWSLCIAYSIEHVL
jgi:hypothetical protein